MYVWRMLAYLYKATVAICAILCIDFMRHAAVSVGRDRHARDSLLAGADLRGAARAL